MSGSLTELVALITALISLATAVFSLAIAARGRKGLAEADNRIASGASGMAAMERLLDRRLNDVDRRLLCISAGVPRCIEGPTHVAASDQKTPGKIKLRVSPEGVDGWLFAAVGQNAPDSVWVQMLHRPDREGRLDLDAWGFEGKYAVYAACDDASADRLKELQTRAAHGRPTTVADLPKGAIQICDGEA
jgi:hypothetical protein